MSDACHRCTGGTGPCCPPCEGELVRTVATGHGIGHGTYRPDVRLLPLVGPQSPGEAWT